MECSLGISNFLEGISSISIVLFSSTPWLWSLRKSFLSLLAIFRTLHSNGYIFPFLLCLSLLFFSQLFVSPPQITILLFCISFSWGWFWSLPPVQCHKPLSIVLQELYQIYLSLLLYNHKRLICFRSYLNGLELFPTFFNLSLNLAMRSSWSEPQSAPGLVFYWLYRASPSLAAQNIINLISGSGDIHM